jgi:gamma-glutamyltranspeptidase/glutathione hydrolase
MAFEYAYDNSTVSYLQYLGHNVTRVASGASYAQTIRQLGDGSFEVATDPRLANAGGYTL